MSTHCTGLSKGWWWLLMFLGLALLYFFMLHTKQVLIENDLQTRIEQQLITEGITNVTVTLKQRGRDVLLSGSATTEQERHKVIKLAEKITGVRVVDNGINVPTLINPTLTLASSQKKIVLSGILPSQQQRDELVQAAITTYGKNNVDNQLTISDNIASPTWLRDSQLLFSVLNSVDTATVTLATGMPLLSGVVHSEAEKTVLHQRVQGLLSMPINEKVIITSQAKIKPPTTDINYSSQTQANIQKAMTACQSKLDQTMSGKNIHFASNKATIKTNSIVLLDQLVGIINKCKKTLSSSEILISGYTDNRGNHQYNAKLSQQRANAVRDYLKKAGISPNLLKAKGFGETHPIASNMNEAGRAKNRRITFSIANKQLVRN